MSDPVPDPLNPYYSAICDAVQDVAHAVEGDPAPLIGDIVSFIRTLAQSKDPRGALAKAAQNALADGEDALAEASADALLKAAKKVGL